MIHKSLQNFIGKPCSIFVEPTARQVSERQAVRYFAGIMESIDDLGVTIRTVSGKMNFFFSRYIIGICEEEILDPNNPEDAKLIEQYMAEAEGKKKPVPAPQPPAPPAPPAPPKEDLHQAEVNNSPFVDLNSIQELARRAKSGMKK
jgi:hypothetical protein